MINKWNIVLAVSILLTFCNRQAAGFKGLTKVCYDGYGCFSTLPPFGLTKERPIGLQPEKPTKIGTSFTLFTRQASNLPLSIKNLSSQFNAEKPTKIIIHGFIQNAQVEWIKNLKDALLKAEDVNVILVDWSKGNAFPYGQATANARIVGIDVALVIEAIAAEKQVKLGDFHIIAHSLGCHVAGYAGQRLNGKVGRISGLDPAGPFFEFTPNEVRLDSSDAVFVDVIHSDGGATLKLGLGLMEPAGHVDFYPNGGIKQPECPSLPDKLLSSIVNLATMQVEKLTQFISCSHTSAIRYYTDSISNRKCVYTAVECKSHDKFLSGKCAECGPSGCNTMGYYASPDRQKGQLHLSTRSGAESPFCQNSFQVYLVAGESDKSTLGTFELTFNLAQNFTQQQTFQVEKGQFLFKSRKTFTRKIVPEAPLLLNSVDVTFTRNKGLSPKFALEWPLERIDIFDTQQPLLVELCSIQKVLRSGEKATFSLCNKD